MYKTLPLSSTCKACGNYEETQNIYGIVWNNQQNTLINLDRFQTAPEILVLYLRDSNILAES